MANTVTEMALPAVLSREPVVRLDGLPGQRGASAIPWDIVIYSVTSRFDISPSSEGWQDVTVRNSRLAVWTEAIFPLCYSTSLPCTSYIILLSSYFLWKHIRLRNSPRHCNSRSSQPSATESPRAASPCFKDRWVEVSLLKLSAALKKQGIFMVKKSPFHGIFSLLSVKLLEMQKWF